MELERHHRPRPGDGLAERAKHLLLEPFDVDLDIVEPIKPELGKLAIGVADRELNRAVALAGKCLPGAFETTGPEIAADILAKASALIVLAKPDAVHGDIFDPIGGDIGFEPTPRSRVRLETMHLRDPARQEQCVVADIGADIDHHCVAGQQATHQFQESPLGDAIGRNLMIYPLSRLKVEQQPVAGAAAVRTSAREMPAPPARRQQKRVDRDRAYSSDIPQHRLDFSLARLSTALALLAQPQPRQKRGDGLSAVDRLGPACEEARVKRLMFITPRREAATVGGREQLSALHERCLGELLGSAMTIRRLAPLPPMGLGGAIRALRGEIDGVNAASIDAILDEIAADEVERVWLDGSNLGRLAAAMKRRQPEIEIITFAHNVEARFFLGGLRHRPGPRALAVLAANYAAERQACRHSDRLLALSGRDSALFGTVYGRTADAILPMAIEDRGPPSDPTTAASPPSLLFVGGAFYANRHGMRWFAKEVAPRLSVRTIVVGRGFEAYRDELESSGQIDVVGAVDDLTPYYAATSAVIAPIFDGSGMKTKVAEALMHGKPVIGTREAFSGYEAVAAKAGWRADTVEEWVSAVDHLMANPAPGFDPELRSLFDQHNSQAALIRTLARLLE